ncbi:MAG: RIP metalloprotease RseP [Roseburia sp.]
MKIIIAILMFSFIIIFHELGHFLLAKKNGIRVNEFCLGLGPTIVGFTKGETKYSLKLLPFGGACMMEGEDEESKDERAFNNKSVWARMAVVFAGPAFNFILAFLLAVVVIAVAGFDRPVVADVMEGYPAEAAGLQAGDVITELNGKNIHLYREVSIYTYLHADENIEVEYQRDGETYTCTLTPKYDEESNRYLFGIYGSGTREHGNVFQVLKYSVYEVKYWICTTLESLKMLVTGQVSFNDLSGPVGIVKSIGDTYDEVKTGGFLIIFLNLMNYSIMLSANLGVMNLLPLPALDGGRLFFLIIEAIRRKRVNPDHEGMVHFAGLVLLMLLMVVVMFNDIRKLFI